ncbi:hypothetical protein Bpfe_000700, partial [Biomphalaria pfeifferi]
SQDAVRRLKCQLTTEPRRCQTFVLSTYYRAKTLSDVRIINLLQSQDAVRLLKCQLTTEPRRC